MARIPTADDRIVFSGAQFYAPPAAQGGAAPMVNFLAEWSSRRRGEVEREAIQRVQGMAVHAQRELGASELAPVPEGVQGMYAEAFEKQSQAVFAAGFARELQLETRNLVEQYGDDPEGFSQAYNAFMLGQLAPLDEANPVVAERLRQEMDAAGLEVMFNLQDNLAAAAEAEARFEALNGYSEFVIGVMDELNATGDETTLARSIAQSDTLLEIMRDAGHLTSDQFLARRQDFRNSAATEQAFGAFRQAAERGDIAGAQAVIDRTERGVLFDSNPAGRAAASQLNTRLRELLRGAEEASANLHQRSMRTIGNYQDLAAMGEAVSFDDPTLQRAFETAVLHANNDGQVDAVQRAQADIAISMALGPSLQQAPVASLYELRRTILGAADRLPRGRVKEAVEKIDDRLQAIDEADFTGDTLRLANLHPSAPPLERERARQRVANQIGAPAEMVPHYSFGEVKRFQQEFDAALDRGDTAQALSLVQRFGSVVEPDVTSQIGLAQQYGQSEWSAINTLAALAGGENAVQLYELARQGSQLSVSERANTNPPMNRISDMAEAASLGHPDIRNRLESILLDAWAAEATMRDEKGQRGGVLWLGRTGVAQEFERLTGGMGDTIELSNGAAVPSQLFAPGVGDRTTRREINALLNQPETFGVVPGDRNTMETLRPRPLPDGGVVWFSTRSPNALVQDPATGGVLVSDLETRVAPVRDAEAEAQGFFEKANNLYNRSAQMVSFGGFTTSVAPLVQGATGASFEDLAAIRMTSESTPTQSHAGRDGVMLLGAEALESLGSDEYRAAWSRMRQLSAQATGRVQASLPAEPPSPRSSIEGAAVAAGLILQKYRAKYDTEEQALAAYWIGEQTMDALGDAWRDALPQEAEQFVSRVLQHKARVGGGGR